MLRRTSTWLAWVAALSMAGVSVWGLTLEARRRALVPDPEALAQAVQHVAARFADGDAVAVLPAWEEAPWRGLEGIGAGTEAPPHPALLRGARVDPTDLARFRRLWVISAFDEPIAPETLVQADREVLAEVRFDPHLRVALLRLPDTGHVASLTDSLGALRVSRRLAGERERRCGLAADGERFSCRVGGGWLDPHLERRDVFHRGVRWLYAHPGPGDGALRIVWPGLPAGATAVVRAGLTQSSIRHEEGSQARITVEVDGAPVDSWWLAPRRYHLERRLIPLPPGSRPVDLAVEVQAAEPRWREVMLEIDVLQVPSASIRADATGGP